MWELWMLDSQLDVEQTLGLLEEAERTGRKGLVLATRLNDLRLTRSLLIGLAITSLRRDDLERAGTLWGAVAEIEREAPLLALHPEYPTYTEPLTACTANRFLIGCEAGRLLTLTRAVELALAEDQTEP